MMGTRYTICRWAINRSDPQNLLSVTLDVPLHIPPIAELLSCAKNQMLQKQLKLFSGCGRTLLPTLLNACILIMGESI